MAAEASSGLGFAAALLLAVPAWGAPEEREALEWLEAMNQAASALSYEGTFVYLHGTQLEAMHVVHTVDGRHERERLSSLNGEPREVVRDNQTVMCISPHSNSVSVEERRGRLGVPNIPAGRLDDLQEYYRFELQGAPGRIAGRMVRVVSIEPRDSYRYGYRLYLDTEHRLPLKTDMLEHGGQPVAQIMFTQLRVDPDLSYQASAPRFDAPDLERSTGSPHVPQHGAAHRWTFSGLPPGFRVSVQDVRMDPDSGARVEHYVLTDGLASVSVYIEPADGGRGFQGHSSMGALNAWGSEAAGHQITVVGEVPDRTVQRLAESIRYAAGDPAQ